MFLGEEERRGRTVLQKLLPGGDPPGPLEERGGTAWRGHGWAKQERRGRTVGVRVTEAEAEELQERAARSAPLHGSLSTPAGG